MNSHHGCGESFYVQPKSLRMIDVEEFDELRQARAELKAGNHEAAFQSFERALELRPQSVIVLVEFAEAIGGCYQIEFAENLLARASQLVEDAGANPIRVAVAFQNIYRPHKAMELLQSHRQQVGLAPMELARLALLYEQHNQLEQAQSAIEECVASVPGQLEPRLVQARLNRLAGQSKDCRRQLEWLLQQKPQPPVLVQVLSEFCQLLDSEGDYRSAFEAMETAKRIQRTNPRVPAWQQRNREIDHSLSTIYQQIDASVLERWQSSNGKPSDPRIGFLIGFPRSGSTLLEQMLNSHPEIITSPERAVFTNQIMPAMCRTADRNELSFEMLDQIPPVAIDSLREQFAACHGALLGDELSGRMLIDKNPNLTSLMALLVRMCPNAKFLFAVRDPRDVIVSCYLRHFALNEFSVAFLNLDDVVRQYLRDVEIWLQMRSLLGDTCIESRHEDLVADMRATLGRVLDGCDLTWSDQIDNYREIANNREINSPSRAQVVRPVHAKSIGRWKNYTEWMEPHFERLAPAIEAFNY